MVVVTGGQEWQLRCSTHVTALGSCCAHRGLRAACSAILGLAHPALHSAAHQSISVFVHDLAALVAAVVEQEGLQDPWGAERAERGRVRHATICGARKGYSADSGNINCYISSPRSLSYSSAVFSPAALPDAMAAALIWRKKVCLCNKKLSTLPAY